MTEFVIQSLELVDVDHDHGHAGVEAAGPFHFFLDTQFEEPSIENSSQAVEIGQLFDPLNVVGVLNRRGANIGD